MKTVQIVGGSGFIGSYLIKQLASDYMVLNYDKSQSSVYSDITNIVDIRDIEKLSKKLNYSDWLIHLAAEHRDDVTPVSLYYDVNVEGTRNLISVIKEKNINKVIFTSTVAVYGLNKPNPDENYQMDPFNDYGKSKLEAENLFNEWYNEDPENRQLIIIRPTVVFGPGNKGNVHNLLKQIASGKFIRIGSGKNKKSMAYVENLAGFIKYCIDSKLRGVHYYNYVDKPDLTMNELLLIVEKSLQKKLPSVKIPYIIGYAGGVLFDALSFITKKNYSVSSIRIKKFCATTEYSAEKLAKSGYKPLFTLEEGLYKTLAALQS